MNILHFADAHIDIANYGKHDLTTGLPVRVMDFLQSLDQIVDYAIDEKVDLVIFAGDAYKDRNPQPTFQREWGKRMMRLSQAEIPTILLVGNHDMSPATGRAHTLQEFRTLNVPHIHVADNLTRLDPDVLGIPVQVITLPWISHSRFMTYEEMADKSRGDVWADAEDVIANRVEQLIAGADPDLPLILTAHASVQGAVFGSERAVMLGQELVLSGNIVNDQRLDYVALGHIHKHQSVTPMGSQPPVIYPGSIERIDFGEMKEDKGFVTAVVTPEKTKWKFHRLQTRRFLSFDPETRDANTFMEDILRELPQPDEVEGAVCRVQLNYPRDWEPLLDEKVIADRFEQAHSLQIQKHRQMEKRARLGDTLAVESLTPLELLEKYWQSTNMDTDEMTVLQALAKDVLGQISD